MNILEIENLAKTYEGGVQAIDGLTFVVPKGSIFGFIGLNGAGKTSTIRILAGLLAKDNGTIRYRDKEIEQRDSSYKRGIGFVLDEPLYFDWMSAREYLQFVGAMYDLSSDTTAYRSEELLEFFDLLEKGNDPIVTLSTGMKKKVSLAAAIIHKPQLVVLDEPLEGIDALAASAIKETLSFMASQGATIFITSHVLDTIERFCSEVAIIHRGKILFQCPTADIRSKTMMRMNDRAYASLEELFVDLVSDKVRRKHPSWL